MRNTLSAISYLNACEIGQLRSSGMAMTSYIQEFISPIGESGNRAGNSNSSLKLSRNGSYDSGMFHSDA